MFKRKLYLYFFILITLSLLISGFVIARISVNRYKMQVEDELRTIAGAAVFFLESTEIIDYDSFAEDLARGLNKHLDELHSLRITVIQGDGTVLGDSSADSESMENHRLRPEVIDAEKYGVGISTRRSSTTDIDYMYLAVKTENGNYLRVSVALSYINSITGSIYSWTALIIILSLILAAIIGYSLSRGFIKPVEMLTNHSVEVSNGNFSHRIPHEPKGDELSKLIESFNETTATLDGTFSELNNRNNELRTLLNAINDGIIAVNSDNLILFANKRINEFPGFELVSSGGGINLIKSSAVLNLIETTMNEEKSIQREISIKDFIFNCYSSYFVLDDGKGVIVSMQDITRLKRLERIRYEFVSNVTHELNTPLTSIKGFIETLKDGAIKDTAAAMQFLNIIDIESERLSNLISDILTLSSIENDTLISTRERVDLRKISNDALLLLGKNIVENSITVINEIPQDCMVIADSDRIKQLFINLLDNAIKYNRTGGSITLYTKDDANFIEIHVRDTGIGIEKKHFDRLFERFYRVDKGRSREMGGTGLGLSIVKHIALLYNGSVSVTSTPGEGSDFCIRLPKINK